MTTLAQSVPVSWQAEMLVRLLVAAALGALIGLEREHHGRPAGLRTHLLVALGSAVAMVVSLAFAEAYRAGYGGAIRVDPARVAYGVMGGVGFIGAGMIIHHGASVRGLTTAASLWCSASVGLAAGFGMYPVALVATGIVLFALVVLDLLEGLIPTRVVRKITLTLPGASTDPVTRCRELLRQAGAKIDTVDTALDFENDESVITFRISAPRARFPALVARLQEGPVQIKRLTVS